METVVAASIGSYVVVEFDEGAWYVGRITKMGRLITVKFNDGEIHAFQPDEVFACKEFKGEDFLTERKARALMVKDKIEKKLSAGDAMLDAFVRKHGDGGYSRSREGASRIRWLGVMWKLLNTHKFGSKLPPPSIRLFRDMGTSMRRRGQWSPSRRNIAIAPALFINDSPIGVLHTLLHEMCHQAVTDLDGLLTEPNGGHGPRWTSWMNKVGLPPERYDTHSDETDYLSDEEIDRRNERRNAIQEIQKTSKVKYYVNVYDLVTVLDTEGSPATAMVFEVSRKLVKVVLPHYPDGRYLKVAPDHVYELTTKYTDEDVKRMRKRADLLLEIIRHNEERRAQLRDMKRRFSYL